MIEEVVIDKVGSYNGPTQLYMDFLNLTIYMELMVQVKQL